MQFKKVKVTNNSNRCKIKILKNLLSKSNKLVKSQRKGISSKGGRSSLTGRITVRHQGGGVKRVLNFINTTNDNFNGIVTSIMYDPIRSSFIALVFELDKKKFLKIIATHFVSPGTLVLCADKKVDLRLGYRTSLMNIPAGSILHNLSIISNKTEIAKSAGTFCQILQKNAKFTKIKMPSGLFKQVSTKVSYGTVGVVSNTVNNLKRIGKAGSNRMIGKRPSVRGIAMNPVDHPHGGRTNGGKHWTTPWGIPTKGKKTVKKKI